MIAQAMAFLFLVSVVAFAAASLVEAGLGRMRMPTRFAWLGALALGPLLLAGRALARLRPEVAPAPPGWVPVLEMPALSVAPASAAGPGLAEAALALWLLSGLGLAALVWRTHRVLLRERSGWESTQVMGRNVFVSADRGPAVAGVWDPWIVLPRWVLALPERELRMVLLHEEEHVRARDTRLLGGALALVVLCAWNPVTWALLRRLRAAMEVDCDRRVLRAEPDRATYGASLLSVAARSAGPSLGLAAFTERSLNLKRRILAMTAKTSRGAALGGGVLVVLGLVVGVQACGVETPVGLAPADGVRAVGTPTAGERAAPKGTPIEGGGAVFTPFTDAPVLVNREEIVVALRDQYPPLLRDAGVAGTAQVYMFIDTTGAVRDTRIDRSSGHPALDDAALRVAGMYRFSPAANQGTKVEVWVAFPITFGTPMVRTSEPTRDEIETAATRSREELEAEPAFTPFTVAPSILNREEVIAAMAREYSAELRSAGVVGTASVYFLIDEEGRVVRTLLDRSSGKPALDEAALRVAEVYRFLPALNKAEKVPVWVSFPISFRVR